MQDKVQVAITFKQAVKLGVGLGVGSLIVSILGFVLQIAVMSVM